MTDTFTKDTDRLDHHLEQTYREYEETGEWPDDPAYDPMSDMPEAAYLFAERHMHVWTNDPEVRPRNVVVAMHNLWPDLTPEQLACVTAFTHTCGIGTTEVKAILYDTSK